MVGEDMAGGGGHELGVNGSQTMKASQRGKSRHILTRIYWHAYKRVIYWMR